MCIQTQIERAQAQKAALDALIQKLEQLKTKTAPVKTLLSELLADYSDVAPEDLARIWQEILAIGQKFGLSVQPLAADELRQWEATNAENERLKAELAKEKQNYHTLAVIDKTLNQQLEKAYAEVETLRSQMPTPTIRAEYELATGNNASEFSEAQCQQQLEVWKKDDIKPELEKLYQEVQAPSVTEEEAQELENIPALTLWQPWATLIQQEIKRIETRSWATTYRGPIAIHAAKKPVYTGIPELLDLLQKDSEPPLGAVVAIANLIDCVEMTPEFIAQQSETELKCGDWTPGRFAWVLEIIRPVVPPIQVSGGQKLWNWSGTSVAAELEYLDKLKAAPESKTEIFVGNEYDACFEDDDLTPIKRILCSHGFFMPDINLGDCYDPNQKYEDYQGWELYYSQTDQEGPVDGIGLYCETFGFWDASTEMIGEDDPTFPQSFTDYDAIVAWTRKVIDKVVAVTPTAIVKSSEVPGQLALEFPSSESDDEEIPELGGNWEIDSEAIPDEPTKLQKLLKDTSNYIFEKLGARVKIDSEFIEDNHGEESRVVEEALFTVADLDGGKVQHYYHSAEDLTELPATAAGRPIPGWNPLGNLMNTAKDYAKKWVKEQSSNNKVTSASITNPEAVLTGAKYDAAVEEELALDDEYEPILITFQGKQWLVEQLNEFASCITILIQTKSRDEGFTATVARKDVEKNDCSLAKCAEQVLSERLAAQKQSDADNTQVSNQIAPEPIAQEVNSEPAKPETETNFEAMGFEVIVHPQYAGGNNLVGATFRFLNPEEMGANDKPKLVFSTSLLVAEIRDRNWRTCAYDLIQDYRDKEAARLEKLANPHATEEDKFIELVKLTPSVGYIKERQTGKLISAYAAFANRDAAGEKTETLAKPRAKKWKEFWHSSFESCGWKVEEPRKVKRMQSEPGAKQVFAYEIKITGKFSIGQLQKLAEEDFSLLPDEVAPKLVKPAAAPAAIYHVIINGYSVASGTEEETQSRFEQELKTFGSEGRLTISLTCNGENVEAYYYDDFAFVRAQDFDTENPEYFVLHRPTKTNFRVYRSLASGSDWINSHYPYCPNLFNTKEAAAVDAVRRQLKAEKPE